MLTTIGRATIRVQICNTEERSFSETLGQKGENVSLGGAWVRYVRIQRAGQGILSLAEVEVGAGGKLGSTQIPSPLVLVVYLHTGHIVDHYNIGANDYSVGGINYEAIKNPVG